MTLALAQLVLVIVNSRSIEFAEICNILKMKIYCALVIMATLVTLPSIVVLEDALHNSLDIITTNLLTF